MNCSFPDCGRRVLAKGLCPGHYEQQRKGRPLQPLRARGFAGLDREQLLAIASKGGRAVQDKGTGHQWDPTSAARAGVKGGTVTAARRQGWSDERLADELQRRGVNAG